MNNPYDDMPLPDELQHLKNMIAKAKSDVSVRLLRDELRTVADEASDADIVKIAEAILQCGVDAEWAKYVSRN